MRSAGFQITAISLSGGWPGDDKRWACINGAGVTEKANELFTLQREEERVLAGSGKGEKKKKKRIGGKKNCGGIGDRIPSMFGSVRASSRWGRKEKKG